MQQKIDMATIVTRNKNKKQTLLLKEYVKDIEPELLDLRRKIATTTSDVLPSVFGDIQDGYSPIIVFCGRQQKGKTRGSVTFANLCSIFLYYRYFNVNDWFFKPIDLLKNINDGGFQILVLDEIGATGSGLNKNEWYSQLAKLFDYIIQTQANLRNIYIFCLPFVPDLTTDIRKYIDYMFSAKRLNKRMGISEFKVYKIYKKYDQLVKNLKDFRQVWIENLIFKRKYLQKEIWTPIEKKCNELKSITRKEKIKDMIVKEDWLS